MKGLPRKIIAVVGMTVDQAQQSLMKHLIQRCPRTQDRSLLRRNSKAEKQGWRSRQKPRQQRMEQPVQTHERLTTFQGVDVTGQKCLQVDPSDFRNQMCKADEAAEHAVSIETVGKIRVAGPPDDVSLVPISPRFGIEQRPQPLTI